ncbi:MAG TPA: tail fiber domain-containing protein [Thermoanaerobaculia bacterium]|nr:tail fiber domain-containing protein [Thermoanaerobaculia bacterium]
MRRAQHSLWTLAVAFACLALVAGAATAAPRQVATLSGGAAGVEFRPVIEYEKLVLTVSGPGGMSFRHEFAQGQAATFSAFAKGGQSLPDGNYNYELLAVPRFSPEVRQRLAAARTQGNERAVLGELRQAGLLPKGSVQSGGFVMENGTFIVAGGAEATGPKAAKEAVRAVTAADQVIPDDLIVQGSACVGLDCVNNENFGFDTIRLKENNLRIHFDDTSTQVGFPANDWRLIANDSASGGSSKFSIEDSTGAKTPFTITAGAATNSIFADSTGRIGLRTSTPVLDLHINTSNTPAIRLEQNNSGGFTAQTWDIGANEANFFVRDVTGGSRLSFRIRPGAPTSSIDISADGDVGIGTASPDAKLHVLSTASANEGKVHIENSNGTTTAREMLDLENNGQALMILNDNSAAGRRWAFATQGANFVIDNQSNAGTELILSPTGNLTITGVYSPSDRNLKKDIVPVRHDVLAKLAAVPISTWTYKTDDVLHMGPMAQDFSAAFGLGIDDKHVSPMDMAGVSLAAVQALNVVVREKDQEISDLKSRIEALEKLVQSLAPTESAH